MMTLNCYIIGLTESILAKMPLPAFQNGLPVLFEYKFSNELHRYIGVFIVSYNLCSFIALERRVIESRMRAASV